MYKIALAMMIALVAGCGGTTNSGQNGGSSSVSTSVISSSSSPSPPYIPSSSSSTSVASSSSATHAYDVEPIYTSDLVYSSDALKHCIEASGISRIRDFTQLDCLDFGSVYLSDELRFFVNLEVLAVKTFEKTVDLQTLENLRTLELEGRLIEELNLEKQIKLQSLSVRAGTRIVPIKINGMANLTSLSLHRASLEIDNKDSIEYLEWEFGGAPTVLSGFRNLRSLKIHNQPTSHIDLSQADKLTVLSLQELYNLAEIQLPTNVQLEQIEVDDYVPFELFQAQTDLQSLTLKTDSETLDLSAHGNLQKLDIEGRYLTDILFPSLPDLRDLSLNFFVSFITDTTGMPTPGREVVHNLDFVKMLSLEKASFLDSGIKSFDFSPATHLTSLQIEGASVTDVRLGSPRYLETLMIDFYNGIHKISGDNVSSITNISDNSFYSANSTVSYSAFTGLEHYESFYGNTYAIDFSDNIRLQTIEIAYQPQLQELRLPNTETLTRIQIDSAKIGALDLSPLTGLQWFSVNSNRYSSNPDETTRIVLPEAPELTYFEYTRAAIEEVDTSAANNLQHLNLNGNAIESIDLSANTQLKSVSLIENNLKSIDIRSTPNLEILRVYDNENLTCSTAEHLKSFADDKFELSIDDDKTLNCGTYKLFDDNQFAECIISTGLDFEDIESLSCKYIDSLQGLEYLTSLNQFELTCGRYKGDLNFSDVPTLQSLSLIDCKIENRLQLQQNVNLQSLKTYDVEGISLDLSQNTSLTSLELSYSDFETVMLPATDSLSDIKITAMLSLMELDLSKNTGLTSVDVVINKEGMIYVPPGLVLDENSRFNIEPIVLE